MSALPGDPGREMNIGRCRGYHAATSLPGGCLFSTDDCTPELCDCQHSNDQFTYLGGMPTLWLEFQVGTITVRVASGTPRLIRGGSAMDQNPFPHTAEPKGGCRPTSGHIRHWAGGLHPCHATGRRADDLCPAGCWRCRAARLTPAGRAATGRLRRLGWVRSIGFRCRRGEPTLTSRSHHAAWAVTVAPDGGPVVSSPAAMNPNVIRNALGPLVRVAHASY